MAGGGGAYLREVGETFHPVPEAWVGAVQSRTCCSVWNHWHPAECHLLSLPQALEEDLNQKKREQEMFFKLSEEAEPRPTIPSRASNFFPYSSGDAS